MKNKINQEAEVGKKKSTDSNKKMVRKSSEIIHSSPEKRPCLSCYSVIIFSFLVGLLGMFIGLILMDLDSKNIVLSGIFPNPNKSKPLMKEQIKLESYKHEDLYSESIENLKANVDSSAHAKSTDKSEKAKAHDKKNTEKQKENKVQKEELQKRTSSKPPNISPPFDITDQEIIANIEEQIIIDNSVGFGENLPTGTSDNTDKQNKRDNQKETLDNYPSKPSDGEIRSPDNTPPKSKKEISLSDLYIEVEKIADDILEEDPDNDMIKQIEPHLEGILKDLEKGNSVGLMDSLIHIKTILLDLKNRLEDSKKNVHSAGKEAGAAQGQTDGDTRVPVDEVIPDPVYFAPLGEGKDLVDLKHPEKHGTEETSQKVDENATKKKENSNVKPVEPDSVLKKDTSKSAEQKASIDSNLHRLKSDDTNKIHPNDKTSSSQKHDTKIHTEEISQENSVSHKKKPTNSVNEKVKETNDRKQTQKPVRNVKDETVNKNTNNKPSQSNGDRTTPSRNDNTPTTERSSETLIPSSESQSDFSIKTVEHNPSGKPAPQSTETKEKPSKKDEAVSAAQKSESHPKKEYSDDQLKKMKVADAVADENPMDALALYDSLLKQNPKSPRVLFRRAQVLDKLSENKYSRSRLEQAINAYKRFIELVEDSPALVSIDDYKEANVRCADRMELRGWWKGGLELLTQMRDRLPNDIDVLNQIGFHHIQINRYVDAKKFFELVLDRNPVNGFAAVHYGYILFVSERNYTGAIHFLTTGIESNEEGVHDPRFYGKLGEALQTFGLNDEAYEIYDEGVRRKFFLSRYQRAAPYVEGLTSRPVWTPEQTPQSYEAFYRKLEFHWKEIKEEGIMTYSLSKSKQIDGYEAGSETLIREGSWNMLHLSRQGRMVQNNCKWAPVTCSLIEKFPRAARCNKCQTKFSVMEPGTKIFPHTGPNNLRLRSHLGLVTPEGAAMRVVNRTLEWQEGKILIFDDSFEHEVWNDSNEFRLILIVDTMHPDYKRGMNFV